MINNEKTMMKKFLEDAADKMCQGLWSESWVNTDSTVASFSASGACLDIKGLQEMRKKIDDEVAKVFKINKAFDSFSCIEVHPSKKAKLIRWFEDNLLSVKNYHESQEQYILNGIRIASNPNMLMSEMFPDQIITRGVHLSGAWKPIVFNEKEILLFDQWMKPHV